MKEYNGKKGEKNPVDRKEKIMFPNKIARGRGVRGSSD